VTLALLAGAGVGLGCWLVLRGLYPPRPPLSAVLARLDGRLGPAPVPVDAADGGGIALRLGRPLVGVVAGSGIGLSRLRKDLVVTGRSLERHLGEKVGLAIFGALLAPATAAALALGGAALPLAVPVWASLVLGLGGFFVPDLGVRAEAAARRRDFRHALGSFLDLVVIALAGGGGVEGALGDAAGIGRGWAFAQLRTALATARVRRETPWAALGRLGGELGVPELVELAASVGLAGTEGAKVRASLAAKAESLRAHQLAEAEGEAQAATERMSLPVVLLFAGFLIFIGYPAIARVLTGF
jgi:Flp pilus assembly protein TadB